MGDFLKLEFGFLIKHPSTMLMALGFLGFGAMINLQELGVGMDMLDLNGPYRLAYFIGLSSIFVLLPAMVFASLVALRNAESGMDLMIGYLWGKPQAMGQYLAIWITTLGLVSMVALGLLLSIAWPEIGHRVQPTRLINYLIPWLLFVVPNSFLATFVVALLCQRLRNSTAVRVGCILTFVWIWMLLILTQVPIFSVSLPTLPPILHQALALIDPSGMVGFFHQTWFLTPAEKNSQLLGLGTLLLANRVFWGCICLGIWFVLKNRISGTIQVSNVGVGKKSVGKVKPVRVSGQRWVCFQWELGQLWRNRAFHAFLVIWQVFLFAGIAMASGSLREFSGRYPTTANLISYLAEPLPPLALMGVLVFSSTILWREHQYKIEGIIGATPISNTSVFLGKLLAIFSIPMSMITLLVMTGVVYQVSSGYYRLELGHYLSLYYYWGLPVILQSLLVCFIHILMMASRWPRPLLGFLASSGILFLLQSLNQIHDLPLWLGYQPFPKLLRVHSEFMGYGMWGSQFHHQALVWSCFGLGVMGFTLWVWPRLSHRAKIRRHAAIAGLFASIWLLLNLQLALQVPHITSQEEVAKRFAYEMNYRHYNRDQVPQYSKMDIRVDLDPEQQAYRFEAICVISNHSEEALHEMLITSPKRLSELRLENATITSKDEGPFFNLYQVQFIEPFLSGTSRDMTYRVEGKSGPFDIDTSIVSNGSVLYQGDFEPLLGYSSRFEVRDPVERRRHGLPIREDSLNEIGKFYSQKREFAARLSTSGDQLLISSGQFMKSLQQNGRNYLRVSEARKIYPMVAYISGNYEVYEEIYQGIELAIYSHPQHTKNVAEILRASKMTLDYCQEAFGSYPFKSLRIVEVPGYHRLGGKAMAGVVALSEDLFLQDFADDAAINNVARNTIHEVLHQWWGETLVPKVTQGQGVLNESITKYLEAVILARYEDQEMSNALMAYNNRRYFSGRAVAREQEVSLFKSENQRYLCYGKGPVVFMYLNQLLGEDQLNHLLAEFLREHRQEMTATLEDLVAKITTAHPQHQPYIETLFAGTAIQELSLKGTVITRASDNQYRVDLEVQASGLGGLTHQMLVSFQDENKDTILRAVDLKDGAQVITLTLPQKPQIIRLDPRVTFLDMHLADQVFNPSRQ